jgi:hypothetical protein
LEHYSTIFKIYIQIPPKSNKANVLIRDLNKYDHKGKQFQDHVVPDQCPTLSKRRTKKVTAHEETESSSSSSSDLDSDDQSDQYKLKKKAKTPPVRDMAYFGIESALTGESAGVLKHIFHLNIIIIFFMKITYL